MNFALVASFCDTITVDVGSPRDPELDWRLYQVFEGLGYNMATSRCLQRCEPTEDAIPALAALDSYRRAVERYFALPTANPIYRVRAMFNAAIPMHGPDVWEAGLKVAARNALRPPPGMTWEDCAIEYGASRGHDVSYIGNPGYVLNAPGNEEYFYNNRIDTAIAALARELPPEQREFAHMSIEDAVPPERLRTLVTEPLMIAVAEHVTESIVRTGQPPRAIADADGRLLPEVLARLAPVEKRGSVGAPPCWALGWPGVRVQRFQCTDDSCHVTFVGFGVEFNQCYAFGLAGLREAQN